MLEPITTETTAVTSGSTAPITLPKPSSSTMMATANPISTEVRSFTAGRVSSSRAPPYSTCTRAARAGATAWSNLVR